MDVEFVDSVLGDAKQSHVVLSWDSKSYRNRLTYGRFIELRKVIKSRLYVFVYFHTGFKTFYRYILSLSSHFVS